MRPTTGYLMASAKQKYDDHLKNTRTRPMEWLNKWKIIMISIKEYDLSEFKEDVWLYNLGTWIRPHSPELALCLKQKASDPLQNHFSTYPTVLREIREHLRDATRDRTVRGNALAAVAADPEVGPHG